MLAITDGKVMYVSKIEGDEYTGAGRLLTVIHTLPVKNVLVIYKYAHLANIRVARGDVVKRGQVIGEVWTTSNPTSDWKPHVHLEWTNTPIRDPLLNLSGCVSKAPLNAVIYPVRC